MSRSQDCQNDRQASWRTMNKKKKGTDRKHSGGVESRPIKDQHSKARGRSRSKSPRRNSWRDEIRQIKSWKEERENRRIKFEDIQHDHVIRHDRNCVNRGRASQRSSKCCKKASGLFSGRKIPKKDDRMVSNETVISSRLDQKGKDGKEGLIPPLAVGKREGPRLSTCNQQVKKTSNFVKDEEEPLVMERTDEKKSVEQSRSTPARGYVDGAALETSISQDSSETDDKLQSRIAHKNIFTEQECKMLPESELLCQLKEQFDCCVKLLENLSDEEKVDAIEYIKIKLGGIEQIVLKVEIPEVDDHKLIVKEEYFEEGIKEEEVEPAIPKWLKEEGCYSSQENANEIRKRPLNNMVTKKYFKADEEEFRIGSSLILMNLNVRPSILEEIEELSPSEEEIKRAIGRIRKREIKRAKGPGAVNNGLKFSLNGKRGPSNDYL